MRMQLEEMLGERCHHEAMVLISGTQAPENIALPGRVVRLEQRWLRMLAGGDAPLYRTGDGHHPAWEKLSDEAAKMAFMVDDDAGAEKLAERSGLTRHDALGGLVELMEVGLISLTRPVSELPAPPARHTWAWVALGGAMVVAASAVLLVGGQRTEPPAPAPAVELRAAAIPASEPPSAPSVPAERRENVEPVAVAVPTPTPTRAASPAPRITITDVSSEGVPSEVVIAAIDRVAGRIGACWSESPPDRRPQTLRAVVTFDGSGRVSQAAVWRGPPPQLQRCVRDALAEVRVSVPAGRASFAIESTRR